MCVRERRNKRKREEEREIHPSGEVKKSDVTENF